jgi:hypothetical protein
VAALVAVTAHSLGHAAATVPDDATIEASGATIGTIEIRASDVFDPERPGEDRAVFRAANKVHPVTRDGVIRHLLTFREGDRYSRRVLDESERALRKSGFLYDASIVPSSLHDGVVDVVVSTRDVWTLKFGLGFGRAGGVNRAHFGLEDGNFLGTGKNVAVKRVNGVDRTETIWRYRDPSVFGSRVRMDASYSNNSDGQAERLSVERPFYALDARWAAGGGAETFARTDSLYAAGEAVAYFGHTQRRGGIYGGFGSAAGDNVAHRWTFGFDYLDDRFVPDPLSPPAVPLEDRTLAFPWVGFDRVLDGYVKTRDLDKIGRTEDLDLGRSYHLRLGWSDPAFGATIRAAILDAGAHRGFALGRGQTVGLDATIGGRFGSSGAENVLGSFAARYDKRYDNGSVLHAAFRFDRGHELDPETQIVLGGDNGLRGYPLRYAVGSWAWLATIEQRAYWDREWFKLVRVGGAVFLDVGAAGGSSSGVGTDFDTLRDIGVGLRLGQSRSSHASMIHIDLAAPIGAGNGVKGVQLLITTGETF